MRNSAVLLAALGLAATSSVASAAVLARIQVAATDAVTGTQIGEHEWIVNLPGADGGTSWGVASGTNSNALWLRAPGTDGAEDPGVGIHGVSFSWIHDPVVTANFNVSAGITNTIFTVNSAILSFGTLSGAYGQASAAITVTDSATFGTRGSVSLNGLQPGGNAFSARYDDIPSLLAPVNTFANLIPGGTFTIPQGTTQTYLGNSASFPGYDPVSGDVAKIQSQFKFSLSAGDQAAGTSVFEIIPAPGTASLLGLGGLLLARRRRV